MLLRLRKSIGSGLAVAVLLGMASVSFAKPSRTAGYEKLKGKIHGALDAWHKKASFPGATIGVAMPNGDSFGVAIGYSDRDKKTAMKPGDIMMAGSVGKTYVAATTLRLIKEGKFSIDDPISKFLGDEKWFKRLPNANQIKIRNLMNHTSGLVRYEFKSAFLADMLADRDKNWKPRELVAYLLDTKAPFEAGKGWEYSDTNYIVLGIIIEKVTGRKYYDLAREGILDPLNLENTKPQVSRTIDGLIPGYAGKGHRFGGEDQVYKNGKYIFNPQWEWTGGGMVTNSTELARWAKHMYEGKAFPKEMLKPMLEGTDAPMLGKGTKYGLGVIIRHTPRGVSYGHSGFFPGYYTDMMYFPKTGIAVAIQVNSTVFRDLGRNPAGVLLQVAGIVEEGAA